MPTVTLPGTNRKIVTFDDAEGTEEFRLLLQQVRRAGGTPLEAGELQDIRQMLRQRGHQIGLRRGLEPVTSPLLITEITELSRRI